MDLDALYKLSPICEVCEKIDFTKVLRVREWDAQSKRWIPAYQPVDPDSLALEDLGLNDQDQQSDTHLERCPAPPTSPASERSTYQGSNHQVKDSDERSHDHSDTEFGADADYAAAAGSHSSSVQSEDGHSYKYNDDDRDNELGGKSRAATDGEDANEDENADNSDETNDSEDEARSENSDDDANYCYDDDFKLPAILESELMGVYDPTLPRREVDHGQVYHLGAAWEIMSRGERCDLCNKLWLNLQRDPDAFNDQVLTRSCCALKLIELKGHRTNGTYTEVRVLNLVFIHAYKTGYPKSGDWKYAIPAVLQGVRLDLPSLSPDVNRADSYHLDMGDTRRWGQARFFGDRCDPNLLRDWVKFCEDRHDHSRSVDTSPMQIRLIDVQSKCIIDWSGPVHNTPRFVALSYPWGKPTQKLMLTKSQINESQVPGYLEQPLDQTVSDAIDLVAQLDERYLWVDALCILQDCNIDKAHQIPQMHRIFGSALFTIVAAAGEDANAGLPGTRPNSRPGSSLPVLRLANLWVTQRKFGSAKFFAHYAEFVKNYLCESTYQTRAWTFQEAYLSTRAMIFTESQVYWECGRCTWCEETRLESDEVDFDDWRGVKDTTPWDVWEDQMERKAQTITPWVDEIEIRKSPGYEYASLVKEYSVRRLTHDQDVLSAFTGVLHSIQEREGVEFRFGLRTKHFGNDLLFNILTPALQRFPDRSPSEYGFPSWSWLSWKSRIEIANAQRTKWHDFIDELNMCDGVKCYALESSEHESPILQLINDSGGWRFNSSDVARADGIYDPTDHFVRRTRNLCDLPSKIVGSDDDEYEFHECIADRRSSSHDADSRQGDSNEDGFSSERSGSWISEDKQTAYQRMEEIEESNAESQQQLNNDPSAIPNRDLPSAQRSGLGTEVGLVPSPDLEPEYSQDLRLSDVQSHPAFSSIQPGFHIMFRTFFSIVLLVTEVDNMESRLSHSLARLINRSGARTVRIMGPLWQSEDGLRRQLYALKPQSASEALSMSKQKRVTLVDSECNRCGESLPRTVFPDGFGGGKYVGFVPHEVHNKDPWHDSWPKDAKQHIEAIPDGTYLMLWMNNNQLPMFGHLLCRPVDKSALSNVKHWHEQVLERVAGAVGPTEILTKAKQEKYCANWGTIVLS